MNPRSQNRMTAQEFFGEPSLLVMGAVGLGYPCHKEGVCTGYAYMGMLAMLTRNLKSFHDRMLLFYDLMDKVLGDQSNRFILEKAGFDLNQLEIIRREQGPNQVYDVFLKNLNDPNKLAVFKDILQNALKKLPKTSMLDLQIFFEGLSLFHMPDFWSDIFTKQSKPLSQAPHSVLSLLTPVQAEKLGGITPVTGLTSVYNEKSLAELFRAIRNKLLENPKLSYPVSFIIHGYKHSIMVGFDPLSPDNQWSIINSNNKKYPIYSCNDDDLAQTILAQAISSDLSVDEKNKTAIGINLYVTQNNAEDMKSRLRQLQNTKEWNETQSMIALPNTLVENILQNAVQYGHIESVRSILKNKNIDLNKKDENGVTPLILAITCKHSDIARLLLEDPRTNPNEPSKDKGGSDCLPLSYAVEFGPSEIANVLATHHKTNTNIINDNKSTLLFNAVSKQDYNLVKTLLTNPNTNPNLLDEKIKITPLMLAVVFGDLFSVCALLLHSKTDPTIMTHTRETAKNFAERESRTEIIALFNLFEYAAKTKTPLPQAARAEKNLALLQVLLQNEMIQLEVGGEPQKDLPLLQYLDKFASEFKEFVKDVSPADLQKRTIITEIESLLVNTYGDCLLHQQPIAKCLENFKQQMIALLDLGKSSPSLFQSQEPPLESLKKMIKELDLHPLISPPTGISSKG